MERIGLEAVLDDGDFQKGISNYTSGLSKAESHTKDTASSIGGHLKNMGSAVADFGATVAKIGFAAAAAGVTALAGALTFSVKAAMDAQVVEAQLDAVLLSTGKAAEKQAQQWADAQGKTTTVSKLSAEELGKLNQELLDTELAYKSSGSAMQEQKQRIYDLTKQYGENGLATIKAKDKLLEMNNAANKLTYRMDDLHKAIAGGGPVTVSLASALGLVAPQARMTKDELLKMADALGKTTMFEDDAIVAGESMLLTFTNIGKDVFPATTEAMLNVSQAMGQDLKSSAVQLGKALNDPVAGISALTRIGVTFTDAQKDMIKKMVEAGDVVGAQKIILAELNTEFGGSAVAAGKTLPGQLTILKNTLGNVAETIGTALLPGLTKVASGIAAALQDPKIQAGITSLAGGLSKLASGDVKGAIEGVSVAIMQIFGQEKGVAVYQFLTNLQTTMSTVFTFIQTNIVPILQKAFAFIVSDVIPPLVAAFKSIVSWVVANWPQIQETIKTVVDMISKAISFVVTNVIPPLVAGFRAAVLWVTTNWPMIQKTIQTVIETIRQIITTVMSAIRTFWEQNGEAIMTKALAIWQTIQNFIAAAIAFVQHIITSTIATVLRIWNDNHDAIMATVSRIWKLIQDVIQTAVDIVQGIIKVATDLLKGDWGKAWEDIKALLKTAWDGMLKLVKDTWELIKTAVTLALGIVKTLFGDKWEEIRKALDTKLTEIKTLIGTTLDNVKKLITDKVDAIKNAAKEIGENIINGITDGIAAAKHFIESAIQGLLNMLPDWAKKLLGIGSPSKVGLAIGANFAGSIALGMESAIPNLISAMHDVAGVLASPARVTAPATSYSTVNNYNYNLSASYRNHESEGSLRDTVRLLQAGVG